MKRVRANIVVLVLGFGGAGLLEAQEVPLAPLLTGLGEWHFPISTQVEKTQVFFDQGLRLIYGFNHAEAVRSFREAARHDPQCAMAFWGQALGLGPNINDPAPWEEREQQAYAAIQKALQWKSRGTAREQALIEALATRFSAKKEEDRSALNQAYAEAMAEVFRLYPEDADVAVLYADAVMNTTPWDYWSEDGREPKEGMGEALAALEGVLKRHPEHAGAHHFYIHAVEASADPDRGVPSAERLASLAPGAGHLVHMPSHIFIRVGRYADASQANLQAIQADEDYLAQCHAQGLYPVGYYPHNIHFLWASATLEGKSALALEAARKVAEKFPHDQMHEFMALQDFLATPLFALVRFGKWDEILAEPAPASEPFLQGMWHYARGLAWNAQGKTETASAELSRLKEIAENPAMAEVPVAFGMEMATPLLQIAFHTLAGEIAARQNDFDGAITNLREAVKLQDRLRYNEPPSWHHPVRQILGAVLLEAGRPQEAEAVYREDLRRNRENGWSLFGLLQSLRAQGRSGEAEAVGERFQKAWRGADITLTGSRF